MLPAVIRRALLHLLLLVLLGHAPSAHRHDSIAGRRGGAFALLLLPTAAADSKEFPTIVPDKATDDKEAFLVISEGTSSMADVVGVNATTTLTATTTSMAAMARLKGRGKGRAGTRGAPVLLRDLDDGGDTRNDGAGSGGSKVEEVSTEHHHEKGNIAASLALSFSLFFIGRLCLLT